jgi:hypothetical protein
VIPSTSYYVQQFFSVYRGDAYLPSTLPNKAGPLFWGVTRRTATGELIIKVHSLSLRLPLPRGLLLELTLTGLVGRS